MIMFENEVVSFLGLPSIPKKEWDGKSPFDKGVGVVELSQGNDAYVVCKYQPEQAKLIITKVFSLEQFKEIKKVYVVPNYMNNINEVPTMDLDEDSKKKAAQMLNEAHELETENSTDIVSEVKKMSEWVFDEITCKEEAIAWLKNYNSMNKIKGRVPSDEETIKMRLYSIYKKQQKKK